MIYFFALYRRLVNVSKRGQGFAGIQLVSAESSYLSYWVVALLLVLRIGRNERGVHVA